MRFHHPFHAIARPGCHPTVEAQVNTGATRMTAFASGSRRSEPYGPVHTTFQCAALTEYLHIPYTVLQSVDAVCAAMEASR